MVGALHKSVAVHQQPCSQICIRHIDAQNGVVPRTRGVHSPPLSVSRRWRICPLAFFFAEQTSAFTWPNARRKKATLALLGKVPALKLWKFLTVEGQAAGDGSVDPLDYRFIPGGSRIPEQSLSPSIHPGGKGCPTRKNDGVITEPVDKRLSLLDTLFDHPM